MSDGKDNKDGKVEGASSTGGTFSRRKLVYVAPAFLSRRMFYSQVTCAKQGGQQGQCLALPGTS